MIKKVKDSNTVGGHKQIYKDLVELLKQTDIHESSRNLGLTLNNSGEAEVPFFGSTYLVSGQGVRRSDNQRFLDAIGSVLIHYILRGSRSRPGGQFVTLAELAGPLFKQGDYSRSALEQPVVKRFQKRLPELLSIAPTVGGRQGGEAGLGGISLIFDLLPHIPLQLIFYDQDDEFPARATLLFDRNATQLIDFEVLAVLVTVFVQSLTKTEQKI
ncbi:MAG: DUF3786 domain-containing protein [Desulfatirhabdiaceae bacterium]